MMQVTEIRDRLAQAEMDLEELALLLGWQCWKVRRALGEPYVRHANIYERKTEVSPRLTARILEILDA